MQPDNNLKREEFLNNFQHSRPYHTEFFEKWGGVIAEVEDDIEDLITQERAFQLAKWGDEIHHPFKMLAILGEEKGEADKAALDGNWANYEEELIQVAAVAIRAIQAIRRHKPLRFILESGKVIS